MSVFKQRAAVIPLETIYKAEALQTKAVGVGLAAFLHGPRFGMFWRDCSWLLGGGVAHPPPLGHLELRIEDEDGIEDEDRR